MKAFKNQRFFLLIPVAICFIFMSCEKESVTGVFKTEMISTSSVSATSFKEASLNLKVVTFNVLAPCWASPTYYPAGSVSKLERIYRRNRIISFLNQSISSGAAVIALQEVQIDEYPFFYEALKTLYEGSISFHNDSYWASWITPDPPFARNGNALFLRKDIFTNVQFSDKPLSDDGNHCVYATAQSRSNAQNFRIASIHLDADNSSRRNNELSALFAILPYQAATVDIVAGDFNAALSSGNLSNLMRQHSFYNALDVAGIPEQTHPFTTSYNRNTNWGPIDHIAYRNASIGGKVSATNDGMPTIDNGVIDFNVWKQFPSGATFESNRISKNFDNCGSDHFPVISTLMVK
jgi:endonuclease/exonuclease/phosphatase family metal-dependent hydrolase